MKYSYLPLWSRRPHSQKPRFAGSERLSAAIRNIDNALRAHRFFPETLVGPLTSGRSWRDSVKRGIQNLARSGSSMVTELRLAFENVVREFGLKSNSGPRILPAPLNIGGNCFCPSEKFRIDDQAGG